MGEWPTYPLSSFVDPSRSICYGIVQPGAKQQDGVPIVRVNNFRDGGIDTDEVLRVAPEIEHKYSRSRLVGGELLVTLVGTMGLSAIAPCELRGWNVARAVGVVPLRDDVDKRWVNFVVRSAPSQDFINTHANTTVQATFNLKDLARLPVPMPPDEIRTNISELLSALDDKIELNRQTNETLEALARAIFKDWFVDFGPTRAKAEGRPPYLAPELWELFPDALDDEDKPVGWTSHCLTDIAEQFKRSVSPTREADRVFEHYSLPAFDAGQEPVCDLGETIKSNKTLVPEGAILLSKLNPEISRVWLPYEPSNLIQVSSTEFLVFKPKKPVGRGVLYCLFRDSGFQRTLVGMVTGTSKSHQRVSPKALMELDVLVGKSEGFSAFENIVSPLLNASLGNRIQARTLSQTRNLLLPKLMSGEIRLRDGEKLVEDAA